MKRPSALVPAAALLAVLIAAAGSASAQLCIQYTGGLHTENFNTLTSAGTSNIAVPIGFAFIESGSGANITYAAADGSSNTGNTYSFGAAGSTERALGEISSGTVRTVIGGCIVNNTSAPLSSFSIGFTGEQWRLGAADGNTDRLDFQYSLNAVSLDTGAWTDIDSLDFVSPVISGTAGARDGNAAANRRVFDPLTIVPPSAIAPGAILFFRWVAADIASNDDGLAIDDFSFSATLVQAPVITSFTAVKGSGAQSNQRIITVTGTGVPGRNHQLLRSFDLLAWDPVGTVAADGSGAWSFTGSTVPLSTPRLFVRVKAF